jgi:hypothetical protein
MYSQLFNILPKEVEYMIYEFNPEHRELMKQVMKEVASLTYGTCTECGENMVYTPRTQAFYDYCKYGKPFKRAINPQWCQPCDSLDYYGAFEDYDDDEA